MWLAIFLYDRIFFVWFRDIKCHTPLKWLTNTTCSQVSRFQVSREDIQIPMNNYNECSFESNFSEHQNQSFRETLACRVSVLWYKDKKNYHWNDFLSDNFYLFFKLHNISEMMGIKELLTQIFNKCTLFTEFVRAFQHVFLIQQIF